MKILRYHNNINTINPFKQIVTLYLMIKLIILKKFDIF